MTSGASGFDQRVSIDAGQSSVRVRIDGADRREHSFPGLRTDQSPVEQVARLLAEHGGWRASSIAVSGHTGVLHHRARAGAVARAAK